MFFRKKKENQMLLPKIPQTKFVAVAYEGNGQMPYFEKTMYFEFYTVINGKKVRKNMLSLPDGKLVSAVDILRKLKTDYVVSRGFGPKALHELKRYQIKCCIFDGGPGAAFRAWLAGKTETV